MDNSGRDTQGPQGEDSNSGDAPPEHPDGGVGQDRDPLIKVLHRINEEQDNIKTAKWLGVDRKTVWRALDAGRLTPWLRNALEREHQAAKVAAERVAAGADRLDLRVEELERRLQGVEGQLAGGLGRLGEELAGLRDEVRTLAWTRPGGVGQKTPSTLESPHRTYLHLVTVEALPDDAEVFGDAMPLVAEWRDQCERFKAHGPSVEGLEAEVRMLEWE